MGDPSNGSPPPPYYCDIMLFKAPVSAPENITFANVTLDSVVLQWSTIPEEDLRGFLLGYVIHYTEYNHKGATKEKSKLSELLDVFWRQE